VNEPEVVNSDQYLHMLALCYGAAPDGSGEERLLEDVLSLACKRRKVNVEALLASVPVVRMEDL
jgi:hypothetical protein